MTVEEAHLAEPSDRKPKILSRGRWRTSIAPEERGELFPGDASAET
jgi:hypothetical protein